MTKEQSDGRRRNAATPGEKPDTSTSDEAVAGNGKREARSAGPDGPDATVIGDTFKKTGG